jgi:hypothetical protein
MRSVIPQYKSYVSRRSFVLSNLAGTAFGLPANWPIPQSHAREEAIASSSGRSFRSRFGAGGFHHWGVNGLPAIERSVLEYDA